MKSLKSRLKRQDAPGSASSGATAAASAVSPAARARSGLPAFPSRGVLPYSEARTRSSAFPQRARLCRPRRLLPQAGGPRGPGDPGDPPLRYPRASAGRLLAPLLQVSQLLVLRNQIATLLHNPVFLGWPSPQALPSRPPGLALLPTLALCGPGWGFAPLGFQVGRTADPAPPGGDSGPSVSPRLGALRARGLAGRLVLAAVALSLGKFDF